MSHWDDLAQSSQLAARASAEISANLKAQGLQASLMEQNHLRSLREAQMISEQQNQIAQSHAYQQQLEQEMSKLRQAVARQSTQIQSPSRSTSSPSGLTMAEMEMAVKRILREEEKKKDKKQDVSGLKRLLEKV